MLPVIRECQRKGIPFEICTTNEDAATRQLLAKQGFTVTTEATGELLVVTVFHMYSYPYLIKYPKDKVIVLQHAWDSALQLVDDFWAKDMGHFGAMCVGGEQDYEFLQPKYGDRIIKTGIPRFDVLRELYLSIDRPIRDKPYGLAAIPFAVNGENREWAAFFDIVNRVDYPIYFKGHPQHDLRSIMGDYPNIKTWVWDSIDDEYEAYKFIIDAEFLVTANSFMCVEAAMVNLPTILWSELKAFEDPNHRQEERIPADLSCSFGNLHTTSGTEKLKSMFLFDGKNTERVMKVIEERL
jgi:hypothetical protein